MSLADILILGWAALATVAWVAEADAHNRFRKLVDDNHKRQQSPYASKEIK